MIIRGTLIPNACTSARFSVAARRYEPSFVRSITYQVAPQITSEATITHARYLGRNMNPRLMPPLSSSGIR